MVNYIFARLLLVLLCLMFIVTCFVTHCVGRKRGKLADMSLWHLAAIVADDAFAKTSPLSVTTVTLR